MTSQHSEAMSIIKRVKSSGGIVIRKFRSNKELAESLQEAIDDGRECAFWPSREALRILFNTQGFISVVRDVELGLRNFHVQVEPKAYGIEHLYVISPVAGRDEERP